MSEGVLALCKGEIVPDINIAYERRDVKAECRFINKTEERNRGRENNRVSERMSTKP